MAGARGDILAGRAYVELFVKNNRFTRGLRDAKQRLNQFGADMQAFGRQMVMVSAAAIIPLTMATKTFADFDDAMRQVKAVTGATGEEFVRMTAHAKMLGATTSFTAIEVANLKAELGRAGFNPAQIDAMTASVLNLARATGTDATQASGIMAASIRQFGLQAGDAGRVADSLTVAANKSFNTVEQLGEALSYAGPVAADFNMSIEDTLAILGGLGNVGIQGSNAGTALRRLLTLTGAEAQKLQGIFGVSFMDATGNARPLVDVLGEVNEATKDMGSAQRAKMFNEAFGLLGITGASAIGKSVGDIKALRQELEAAAGAADKAATEMDAGLGGALRILSSAYEATKIAIGEAMAESLTGVAEFATGLLGAVKNIIENNQQAVVTFGKWAAIVGSVGAGLISLGFVAKIAATSIGGLLAIVNLAVFGIGLLGSVFAIFTSPITLAVVALAGLGAALIRVTGTMNTVVGSAMNFSRQFTATFSGIRQTVSSAMTGIFNAIAAGDLSTAGQIAMTSLQLVFVQGLEMLDNLFGGALGDTFAKITSQILGGDFAGAWSTAVLGMQAVWESFSNGIVTGFVKAGKAITDTWQKTVDNMANYILRKAGEGGLFGAIFEQISGVNVQAEIARAEKLRAQGVPDGGPDIFSQVADGTYSDPATQAAADKMKAQLDALQAQSDSQVAASGQALGAAVTGTASSEIERLQKELADLQKQATQNRERADAEAVGGAGAGGVGAAGLGGGGRGGASTATSSIHGLLAMGQGASRDPIVNELRESRRERKDADEKQLRKNDELIAAIENNIGLGLV